MPAFGFWQHLAGLLDAGRHVFVAIVAAHEGHSPGTAGAKLLVADDGTTAGSIGGGIMELDVTRRARALLAGDPVFAPEVVPLDHRPGSAALRSGLVCAGGQTNVYLLCTPERDGPAVRRAAALQAADRAGQLVLSSEGFQVEERGGLTPFAVSFESGGTWRYVEQLLNRRRLAILGSGHCGKALARQMRPLGYVLHVFDSRPEVLDEDGLCDRAVLVEDYRAVGEQIPYPELTAVVLMTDRFDADVQGLLGVLPFPFPFIGLMGSAAKIGRVYWSLRKHGVTRDAFARVHAPVGLPIGSDTPEEIAVSVAAQLIRLRSEGALPG